MRTMRFMEKLRPSHEYTVTAAAVLLACSLSLSRILGYVREACIAWVFGAGQRTDAYVAAFTIPDTLSYLLASGSIGITITSILTRYRSEGKEEVAHRGIAVVMTVMLLILAVGIIVLEFLAPMIEMYLFPHFTLEQQVLCARVTRILLPGKIFFCMGAVFAAILFSRRLFLVPTTAPLLYNLSLIVAAITAGQKVGIVSLGFGVVIGLLLGNFLLNAVASRQTGFRFRPSLDISNPAFREWVRLSLPLGLGVSIIMADSWYQRYFASGSAGEITRLYYAKQLLSVPLGIIAQTAGQASLPFFAKLFGESRKAEFEATINNAITRVFSLAVLCSGWLMATSPAVVDLVYRRGQFTVSDARYTALYLAWFSVGLGFWAIEVLYARAFFAAGDSLTPMVAATVITVALFPIYGQMFRTLGPVGLAIASDIGIAADALVLAVLLRWRGLVDTLKICWSEIGKIVAIGAVASTGAWLAGLQVPTDGSRSNDLLALFLASVTWGIVVLTGIWLTNSQLLYSLKSLRRSSDPERNLASLPLKEPVG